MHILRHHRIASSLFCLFILAGSAIPALSGPPGNVVLENLSGQPITVHHRYDAKNYHSWNLRAGQKGYLRINGQKIRTSEFRFTLETSAGSTVLRGGQYDRSTGALIVRVYASNLPRRGQRDTTIAPETTTRVQVRVVNEPEVVSVYDIAARNNTRETLIFSVESYIDASGKRRRGGEFAVRPGQTGRTGIRARSVSCGFQSASGYSFQVQPRIEGRAAVFSVGSRQSSRGSTPQRTSRSGYTSKRISDSPNYLMAIAKAAGAFIANKKKQSYERDGKLIRAGIATYARDKLTASAIRDLDPRLPDRAVAAIQTTLAGLIDRKRGFRNRV